MGTLRTMNNIPGSFLNMQAVLKTEIDLKKIREIAKEKEDVSEDGVKPLQLTIFCQPDTTSPWPDP
jgi:hypothetical protein